LNLRPLVCCSNSTNKALGYSACFLSAVNHVAGSEKIKLPDNVIVEAHVSIGTPSEGPKPFALAVELLVTSDAKGAEEKKKLQEVVEKAHEVSAISEGVRGVMY
jgi:osmotically inducible protein OsmC